LHFNLEVIRNSEGIFNYTYIYEGETLVARINPDGSKYFYHPDHLGSTTLITDESGNVVEDNYYLPYGELVGESDEKRLYENKEFDSDGGQYFYNARYYDPYKSMFVQPDSIIPNVYDPQQLNRYAFERGNPYSFVDPSGHAITPIGLLGSSGIRQEIGTTLIKGYRNNLNYGDLNLPQMIGLKTYDILLKSQIDVDYGINAELNNPIVEASPYYNTLDQIKVREDVVYGLSSMALFVGGEVFGGTLSIVSYVDTGSSLISNKGIIEQTKDISNNFIDTSIKVFESIYIVLILFLGYLYFLIRKYLKQNYLNSNKRNLDHGGIAFLIPIFIPKKYFNKKTFLKDYFLYIFSFICLFAIIYLFYKLIGIL